jgi:hypothetical protein
MILQSGGMAERQITQTLEKSMKRVCAAPPRTSVFVDSWKIPQPSRSSVALYKILLIYSSAKIKSHEAASLPNLVENLVKNWEVEASFKTNIDDWRTIDRPNYTFSINGGPPQSAEHMLKVGTYNAIIASNDVAFKWRHWGTMKNDYVGFNEYVKPSMSTLYRC